MALYEHVFICRQDISQQQVETLTEQLTSILTDKGGKVTKNEYWGLRPLAYRIRKNRKAHYALMNIDAPHDAIAEMERQMRLNDDVIRFLTIRVDDHDSEPSAPLLYKRRERDERRGPRRGRFDDAPPRGRRSFYAEDDTDADGRLEADIETDMETNIETDIAAEEMTTTGRPDDRRADSADPAREAAPAKEAAPAREADPARADSKKDKK